MCPLSLSLSLSRVSFVLARSLAHTHCRTEVKRINYMLRVYLRTRLRKIESFVLHILDNADMYARLSPQEQEYARSYTDAMDHLFTSSVLTHLPENFDSLLKQSNASEEQDMGTHTSNSCPLIQVVD